MLVIHATKENFEVEVLQSEVPVLVDFWASWCGPCKMVAPLMDTLAEEFEGKAKIVKINVDEEGELALSYQVMSIPTVFLFQNGEIVDKAIGAYPLDAYRAMIEKQL